MKNIEIDTKAWFLTVESQANKIMREYEWFNEGNRDTFRDTIFTKNVKRILKNIIEVEGVSRDEAGIILIEMFHNEDVEALERYMKGVKMK